MSYRYSILEEINLQGAGIVPKSDAQRQEATAKEILRRLEDQPGLILADEVGMGKTFVALAVACSVALQDRKHRPVVVMVPSSLQEKWPRDHRTFIEKCLPPELGDRMQAGRASDAVSFLKLLDDAPDSRRSIIFLNHGAMNPHSRLQDGWIKLAVLQQTVHRKRGAHTLRARIARWANDLLRMGRMRLQEDDWDRLLSLEPQDWLPYLKGIGAPPEDGDDPVPASVLKALGSVDTTAVRDAVESLPIRDSHRIHDRLHKSRRLLSECLRDLWEAVLRSLKEKLPLLILDEAHHLKNARTRLASLFQVPDAHEDAKELSERGPMGGMFERMIFLTATPFQLGHHELCSVLERFNGIDWRGANAPPAGRDPFAQSISKLRGALDDAQRRALRLEAAWGELQAQDLRCGDQSFDEGHVDDWWSNATACTELTSAGVNVVARFQEAQKQMRRTEELLKPWVIRHLRSRHLPEPYEVQARRLRRTGRTILPGEADGQQVETGLDLGHKNLLPFLLAARAVACTPEERPVFAEGLASSYQAFLHTRDLRNKQSDDEENGHSATDQDDAVARFPDVEARGEWYLRQLENYVPSKDAEAMASHPKLAATIQRVAELWKSGEKVLVFCHYIATGRALRAGISQALEKEIRALAASQMNVQPAEAMAALEKIGERFDRDGSLGRVCERTMSGLFDRFPALRGHREELLEIIRRFLRTPSFLVRYVTVHKGLSGEAQIERAMEYDPGSRLSLHAMLKNFCAFLQEHSSICDSYIHALLQIQPGTHAAEAVQKLYGSDELQGAKRENILPNVRLVNGGVRQETRQRLLLTFNTPFYPDILIASTVMAEGVDLHLNCRHVIHHDLCWNPSTLEQRTGRIDRLGAKAERVGASIEVFLPYVAETQDEKMYRVVLDRERWFQVVMGEEFRVDLNTTDKMAERIPLPQCAAEALAFRLEVRFE